jgi:putative selenium metabolism hydrolase
MSDIQSAAAGLQDEAVEFLRELIRIPSPSGGEGKVVETVRARMVEVGFDETRIDRFGNVLGRIGDGSKTLAFDAHVDTVGVGDAIAWTVDPYAAEVSEGLVLGRGASDQKAGMAALVYAGALIRRLGLARTATVWIVGSVLEEDCDGLCWHHILSEKTIVPEVVVLTEPTDLNVYRGHRGRMEIEVTTRGRSCHGSAPERGDNAIYKMAPIIAGIARLGPRLADDPFLGPGSVTISEARSTSPSLCAVADSCTIHLDRRLTAGETDTIAIAEIEEIVRVAGQRAEITVPVFERPSHTGLVYPMRQYYPPWALPEDHRFVDMGLTARERVLGARGRPGKWSFSTNGVATMGMHGVPTIGFGPANEIHAHAPTDRCPIEHIGAAIAWYATFASLFATEV